MSEGAKVMTCGKCGKEREPSFDDDCFKVADVDMCESCAMPFILNTGDPNAISEGWAVDICNRGKGKATCAFLGIDPSSVCLKHSPLEETIRQRLVEGSMVAQSDNCAGPPSFEIYNP